MAEVYDVLPKMNVIAEVEVGEGQIGSVRINNQPVEASGGLRRINLGLGQDLLNQNGQGTLSIDAVLLRPQGSPERASITLELFQMIPRHPDGTPVRPALNPNRRFNAEDFVFRTSFEDQPEVKLSDSINLR